MKESASMLFNLKQSFKIVFSLKSFCSSFLECAVNLKALLYLLKLTD